jgi:hypothetical protein
LDGFSSEWELWGMANGTALYVSQRELIWKEQRLTPKFSFHTTQAFKATLIS